MKRFYMTTLALVMVSTSTAFGASNDIYNFLTINGKPLKEYIQNNNQDNNQGNNTNKPSSPDNNEDNNEDNNQDNNINIPQQKPEITVPDNDTNDEITNNTYISKAEQATIFTIF